MACAVAESTLWSDKLTFDAPALVTPARRAGDGPETTISPSGWTYELSNLDLVFYHYIAVALFFAPPDQLGTQLQGTETVPHLLKAALPELLLHCPWVAGRLRLNQEQQRREVVCSGRGVLFLAADAAFPLADLGDIAQPRPSLDMLYPRLPLDAGEPDAPLVALQVTRFQCGAFTLSMSFHHAIMDGMGAGTFVRNLCSIARGEGLTTTIVNTSRREFMKPQVPLNPPSLEGTSFLRKCDADRVSIPLEHGVPKVYRFLNEALEKLKEEVCNGGTTGLNSCSRYQALVALLWKAKAKSLLGLQPPDHELSLRIPVNVREKMVPSLPLGYLGNALCFVVVRATLKDLQDKPLAFALLKIIDAMSKVSPGAVQAQIDLLESLGGVDIRLDRLDLTAPSLVSLPLYQADCGWGTPIYVQRGIKQRSNVFVIVRGSRYEPPPWHVLVVCHSDDERLTFEEAIKLYATH